MSEEDKDKDKDKDNAVLNTLEDDLRAALDKAFEKGARLSTVLGLIEFYKHQLLQKLTSRVAE